MSVGGNSGYMPVISINIKGDKRMEALFQKLDKRMARKLLLKIARKAAKPLVVAAKSKAPESGKRAFMTAHRNISKHIFSTKLVQHRSGELKRSISTFASKNRNLVNIYIGPRTKSADQSNSGWYGHFVSLGTKGYTVKKDRVINFGSGAVATLKAGTHVPGQRAQPFMGPAWAQTKNTVLRNFDKMLIAEIKKVVNES